MRKIVPLLAQHPGYKLYVTGHSLGASLSSIFAFCAAQSDNIPKPVTCVSIASTYVGGKVWRKEFMELEKRGHLRYLRVSNSVDIIPHGPPFDTRGSLYKHVGLNLRLQKELPIIGRAPTYSLQYPTGYIAEIKHAFTNCCLLNFWGTGALRMHSCIEYQRRLKYLKGELGNMYLNTMYEGYFATLDK